MCSVFFQEFWGLFRFFFCNVWVLSVLGGFGLLVFLGHRQVPRLAYLSSFMLLQIRHDFSFVDESVIRDPRHLWYAVGMMSSVSLRIGMIFFSLPSAVVPTPAFLNAAFPLSLHLNLQMLRLLLYCLRFLFLLASLLLHFPVFLNFSAFLWLLLRSSSKTTFSSFFHRLVSWQQPSPHFTNFFGHVWDLSTAVFFGCSEILSLTVVLKSSEVLILAFYLSSSKVFTLAVVFRGLFFLVRISEPQSGTRTCPP